MKKTYSKEDLIIGWEPNKCIHSANCVKHLNAVFKPKERPWVQPEGGSKDDIIKAIDSCPSAALTWSDSSKNEPKADEDRAAEATYLSQGPLRVKGAIKVIHSDGREEVIKKATAFCRCGHSKNQPYCDGTHKQFDFSGGHWTI